LDALPGRTRKAKAQAKTTVQSRFRLGLCCRARVLTAPAALEHHLLARRIPAHELVHEGGERHAHVRKANAAEAVQLEADLVVDVVGDLYPGQRLLHQQWYHHLVIFGSVAVRRGAVLGHHHHPRDLLVVGVADPALVGLGTWGVQLEALAHAAQLSLDHLIGLRARGGRSSPAAAAAAAAAAAQGVGSSR
jgi:hypothetical protein